MADTALDEFLKRLAALPAQITRKQIAVLAEVSPETVEWWTRDEVRDPEFPAPLPSSGGPKAAKEYNSHEVAVWLIDYFNKESSRGGPRRKSRVGNWADISPSDPRRMTDRELADLQGVTPAGIMDYARRYGHREQDPFPPRDDVDQTRSVADVAAWFVRHKPGSRGLRPADAITIPGTTGDMSDSERAAVLAAAFAALPEQCTTADIRVVTGATGPIVAGWAGRDTFPEPLTPKAFKPRVGTILATYRTSDVAAWCHGYLFGAVAASSD